MPNIDFQPMVCCVYPIKGAGKVRRSLTESSVSRWEEDLQAGTLTAQDAAHLTGTSPFHDLLGLLLPHAALCNRLEQPEHRSNTALGASTSANGASTIKDQKLGV